VTSGAVKLEFAATTFNEAILTATEKWRVLVEDPEATLPWSTHFNFYEETEAQLVDGKVVEGTPQTKCVVDIEFDRKLVDELTGVTTAQDPGNAVKAV
jgi:hypothetical protein